jgi:hypothetical protein
MTNNESHNGLIFKMKFGIEIPADSILLIHFSFTAPNKTNNYTATTNITVESTKNIF